MRLYQPIRFESLFSHLVALESSHAIWEAVKIAKTLRKDQDLVVVSIIYLELTYLCDGFLDILSACPGEATKMLNRFLNFCPNGPTSLTGMYHRTTFRNICRYGNGYLADCTVLFFVYFGTPWDLVQCVVCRQTLIQVWII